MKRPALWLIAAVARNGVIGHAGQLPFRLKADLQRLKALTLGHPLIMGRKTWDSLGGRPLPGRQHIVITRQPDLQAPGATVVSSLQAALDAAAAAKAELAWVFGGGEIYRLALPLAQGLQLTEVQAEVSGDARFPALPPGQFRELWREKHHADADNQYDFDFVEYRRVASAGDENTPDLLAQRE